MIHQKVLLCSLVLAVVVASCEAAIWDSVTSWWNGNELSPWPPSFCNSLDCPRYTVVESTQDYEVRNYSYPTNWVSTQASSINHKDVKRTMFWRLFNYISGSNEKKQKIAMTVPVTTFVSAGHGPACESNFTMSFFIADSITNPPKPSDKLVFLSEMPQTTIYVRSFSGYADADEYMEEAGVLAGKLPTRLSYVRGVYYMVGYDAPYKFWNRHNEIWFIAPK